VVREKVRVPNSTSAVSGGAIGMWPETSTAVAVRLLANDELYVVAPAGSTICSALSTAGIRDK
jgi:hypothetical protein